jgi:hypothetical protein
MRRVQNGRSGHWPSSDDTRYFSRTRGGTGSASRAALVGIEASNSGVASASTSRIHSSSW